MMTTSQLSMRLGFACSLTATWLIGVLGLTPAVTTETEYLWDESQVDAVYDAIVARMKAVHHKECSK